MLVVLPQRAKQVVQETHESRKWPALIEQVGDGAQQVAQQVARTGLRGDVQNDLVEMDLQSQEVEVQRPQLQVEDLAAAGNGAHWDSDLADLGQNAVERAEGNKLAGLLGKLRNRQGAFIRCTVDGACNGGGD